MIAFMIYFDNFSLGCWLYLALHGSYGLCWYFKHCTFPDAQFETKLTLLSAISSYTFVLGPYSLAAFWLASGRSPIQAQTPHPERVFVAIVLYLFGIILMLGQDGQKYFTLLNKRGLITIGYNALSRNSNYLGEMILYTSFNVIAQSVPTWYVYMVIWTTIFL